MDEKMKNDIYDMMDLLNKLYALDFLKDKERFNQMQDAMIKLTREQKSAPPEAVPLPSETSLSGEEGLTIGYLEELIEKMSKMRKKADLTEFAAENEVKADPKYTMDAIRGLILLELIRKHKTLSAPAPPEKSSKSKNTKTKTKEKPEEKSEKKDFMDRWIDFYKKSGERK